MKKIGIIGFGTGAGNVVSNIKDKIIFDNIDIETVAINSDKDILAKNKADKNILIGTECCNGLGCGGNPNMGIRAFDENKDEIINLIKKYDYIFVIGCIGAGCATGCIERISQYLDKNYLLVLQKPFHFEGAKRLSQAHELLIRISNKNTLIIDGNKIADKIDNKISLVEMFKIADEVITEKIKNIIENL